MPPPGVVEVWVADLDEVPDERLALLCARERERAVQIRDELRRRRWSAARAVLRDLLSTATRADPAELELDMDGKPRLRRPSRQEVGDAQESLRFNLSHSGSLALCALCANHEVGVDVELADRRGAEGERQLAIAKRMLGEQVAAKLQALAPHERHEQFLRAWVAHEATVKCLGVGLSGERQPSALAGVWVTPIELGPNAFGALAVQGGPVAVRREVWGPIRSLEWGPGL